MSLKDGEMRAFSLFGAGILTAALFVPVLWFTDRAEAQGPILKDREVLEATLAYRKTPQKQPQKKFDQPDVVKPVGVSHDENKKVEPPKDDKKPKDPKIDTSDPFKGIRRPDEEAGKPTTQPGGDFNGSEKGFAPESKGDPYFGALRADMNIEFNPLSKVQSVPIGCIHLQADGRIKEITFEPPIGMKGDDDVQNWAEDSLKQLQKKRNQNPEPVPSYLLQITSKWLCFKFSVSSG